MYTHTHRGYIHIRGIYTLAKSSYVCVVASPRAAAVNPVKADKLATEAEMGRIKVPTRCGTGL